MKILSLHQLNQIHAFNLHQQSLEPRAKGGTLARARVKSEQLISLPRSLGSFSTEVLCGKGLAIPAGTKQSGWHLASLTLVSAAPLRVETSTF